MVNHADMPVDRDLTIALAFSGVSGERAKIFPNVKTDRVTIKTIHETTFKKVNKVFDKKIYVEFEVKM